MDASPHSYLVWDGLSKFLAQKNSVHRCNKIVGARHDNDNRDDDWE
mgnify:CR=1 FL=1